MLQITFLTQEKSNEKLSGENKITSLARTARGYIALEEAHSFFAVVCLGLTSPLPLRSTADTATVAPSVDGLYNT